jgi:hypothetical protein
MDAGFGIEFMFAFRPTLGLHPPRKDFPAEGFRGVLGKLWGGTRQETGRSEHSMVLALQVVAIVTPFSSGFSGSRLVTDRTADRLPAAG